MKHEIYKKSVNALYKLSPWLNFGIFIILLIALCLGIVGFVIKWYFIVEHPSEVLNEFHQLVMDVFSLILVFEIMELLRLRNPLRLIDVFLTVIARKMLLSPEHSNLILLQSISFSLVLLCRIIWSRFMKE